MKLYALVGTGGFGREVMPLAAVMLQKLNPDKNYKLVFVTEEKTSKILVNDYEVFSLEEYLNAEASEKFFNIAIANFKVRQRIAELLISHGITPFRIDAPNIIELDKNNIGPGAILCPFTTITSNVTIGKFFHANIYSYIAHDCQIGDFVTFAPNVHCNGNIIIEDHVYVGTGAIIRQGTSDQPIILGQGSIIGMGAVVTKSVPPHVTVIGNPAREHIKQPTV